MQRFNAIDVAVAGIPHGQLVNDARFKRHAETELLSVLGYHLIYSTEIKYVQHPTNSTMKL